MIYPHDLGYINLSRLRKNSKISKVNDKRSEKKFTKNNGSKVTVKAL